MEENSMDGNVKRYLDKMNGNLPSAIISEDTFTKIYKMADRFADFAASEYIMETHLNSKEPHVEFSFRILAQDEQACLKQALKNSAFTPLGLNGNWKRIVDFINYWPSEIEDIWLEMDYAEYDQEIPQPCFFFNASQIKKGRIVNENLLFNALKQLVEIDELESL